ncbi:hypothetical protein JXA12_04965 [Candidatus Woesearchaeota archaeon]|nr:hypothetical protein [Candidatus Woesearchaeota archaeon]
MDNPREEQRELVSEDSWQYNTGEGSPGKEATSMLTQGQALYQQAQEHLRAIKSCLKGKDHCQDLYHHR